MTPEFEWDAKKADDNSRKHGITFEEALTVFADPLARIFDDPDHSSDERRELIIGTRRDGGCSSWFSPTGDEEHESLALVKRQRVNGVTMSKTPRSQPRNSGDIRAEYELDYSRAKPNRFASGVQRPVVAVVLESDVAEVFDSSEKVNAQLRAAMLARKPRRQPTRVRGHRRKAG